MRLHKISPEFFYNSCVKIVLVFCQNAYELKVYMTKVSIKGPIMCKFVAKFHEQGPNKIWGPQNLGSRGPGPLGPPACIRTDRALQLKVLKMLAHQACQYCEPSFVSCLTFY